jgi:hypothetical protein
MHVITVKYSPMLLGRVSDFYGIVHLVAGTKHIWSKFCVRYDHCDVVPFFHHITETLVSENIFRKLLTSIVGQDSIVSIVTQYRLDIPGIKSWQEWIFCTCPDWPWGAPTPYMMGDGSFPGVKRPGCDIKHLATYSTRVTERADLYLSLPSFPVWQVIEGILHSTFMHHDW